MIQNVSSFARGVGRKAESACAFFGQLLASATRVTKFNKMCDNDKASRAEGKSLRKHQGRMFGRHRAIVKAYDNYQKGLTLQHQRSQHSSAFFKGTHECAHKVVEYSDTSFDDFYPEFTQHNQDIPSPCRRVCNKKCCGCPCQPKTASGGEG